jgi:hypothetical protein
MIVYTLQAAEVVARLLAGRTHVQLWDQSAVAGTPKDPDGSKHRRAYEWIARAYIRITGHDMAAAPVFVTEDKASAVRGAAVGPSSRLLTLDVPADRILLHDSGFFAKTMLWGDCPEHGPWGAFCPSPDCLETSWALVLTVPSSSAQRQGVVDRIEPEWVVSVEDEPFQ